jgi:DUF2938 family protein
MEISGLIILTGVGATATMDLASLLRRRLWGNPFPNYALVGRWIAHLSRGRFAHGSIAVAGAVRGERTIGWIAHYIIGIAFAWLPVAWDARWFDRPTLLPALLIGLVTVLVPFLVMQPAMGSGLFARRTPQPRAARLQSLMNHLSFGLGLYTTALLVNIHQEI